MKDQKQNTQNPNDQRSNVKNTNNPANKSAVDNKSNQGNPTHASSKPKGK